MYPILRLLAASVTALKENKHSSPAQYNDTTEVSFRCWPWYLDIFFEMNNGRVLTLYDLGRLHFSLRTGFSSVLRDKRWGLVVAGSTVRYRKRVKIFDKVLMRTSIVNFDPRWVYMTQSMWVNGEPASSILIRIGVTEQGRVIDTGTVQNAMQSGQLEFTSSTLLDEWVASEEQRPWPPKH